MLLFAVARLEANLIVGGGGVSQNVFLGVALIGVSALHLIPAMLTGEIPANWPIKPLTRSGKPQQFWITFSLFAAAAIVGTLLLLLAMLRSFFGPH